MRPSGLLALAGLVFSAVSLVIVGDTAAKLLTARGVDPLFAAWSRFALAAALLLPFSGLKAAELRDLLRWPVALRAALIAAAIACILTALKTEPIANVFGAFFIGPVVAFVLAALLLKERPAPLRWALMGLGFAGVILVVKPGAGFTPGMGFALASGVLYGCFLVATRRVARTFRPRFLLISQLLIGAVLLAPLGLSAEMPGYELSLWGLVLVSALGSAAGNLLLVVANRRAETSLIAPLVYSQLISAAIAGILVFGQWPDEAALAGLVLILLSGAGSLAVRLQDTQAPEVSGIKTAN